MKKIFVALVAGFCFTLGYPSLLPFKLFFMPIVGVALLLSLLNWKNPLQMHGEEKPISVRQELGLILLFLLTINFLSFHWIAYTVKEFGSIAPPWNFIVLTLFALIVLPQFWVFYLFIWLQRKYLGNLHFPWALPAPAQHLLWASVFTLLELVTPQQFQVSLGHSFGSLAPYLGLAPFFGAPCYTFFAYYLVFALLSFIRTRAVDRYCAIFFSCFLLCNALFSFVNKVVNQQLITPFNVRIVQANIGNLLKVHSEKGGRSSLLEVYNRYRELSLQPSAIPLDLIIWPETAFPVTFAQPDHYPVTDQTPFLLKEIITQMESPLFIGGYIDRPKLTDPNFEGIYNAAILIDQDHTIQNAYLKNVLIPFGETLPFGPLNHWLSKFVTNVSYFASGDKPAHFKSSGLNFTSVICYEILYSGYVRSVLNSADKNQPSDFIVNLTNDSWYGDTIEPELHLYMSIWRAMEFNLPIIRSTNTGITTVIQPDGTYLKRLEVGAQNNLDLSLSINSERTPTLYQRWGGLPCTILILALLGIIIVLERKNFRQK